MGENQGMIWIILGVIVVAGALMFLGSTMSDSIGTTANEVDSVKAEVDDTYDGSGIGE